ncbi:MAG: hypothetical protein AAFN30_11475 [Actinomycetota bacterium]
MEPTTDIDETPSTSDGFDGFSQQPLVETIALLAERHADGVLRLGPRGDIWFAEGRITLAVGPASPDLAQVLVDADLGDEHELRTLLEGRRRDDERGAQTPLARLLDQRPETHDRLNLLLHEYKLNSLFEILVPGDMDTRFDEGVEHPLGSRFGEHALELLNKAAARMELWRRIAARIPSTTAVFTWSPTLPDGLPAREVTNREWRYLARLDGNRSVAEVIKETGDSAFRVCSALYRLVLEGLIEERPNEA